MSLSKARGRGGELAICDVGKDLDFLRGRRNALVFSWRWRPSIFGTINADTETDDWPVFICLEKLREINERPGSPAGCVENRIILRFADVENHWPCTERKFRMGTRNLD